MSNSKVPNDVQLYIYTDWEWERIIGSELSISDLPHPATEAWRCPKYKRIYFFEENKIIKVDAFEPEIEPEIPGGTPP